jgi:hypothetical protein
MIKIVASVILMTVSLYPAIADAGETDKKAGTSQASANRTLRVADGGRERRGFEVAVDGVLRHLDAGNYEGLAREISAATSLGGEVGILGGHLKQMDERIDAGSGRRFRAIDMYADVDDIERKPQDRFAMMSHLRACGGNICEEQVLMKMIDGRWRLAGLYVLYRKNPVSGKAP